MKLQPHPKEQSPLPPENCPTSKKHHQNKPASLKRKLVKIETFERNTPNKIFLNPEEEPQNPEEKSPPASHP